MSVSLLLHCTDSCGHDDDDTAHCVSRNGIEPAAHSGIESLKHEESEGTGETGDEGAAGELRGSTSGLGQLGASTGGHAGGRAGLGAAALGQVAASASLGCG